MSQRQRQLSITPGGTHGRTQSYVAGFGLSILLTTAAYLLTIHHSLSTSVLVGILAALVVVQFAVQLIFFLHLGQESRPRWRLWVFFFMLMVVLILVLGSIWIMNNLNYHMVSPTTMHQNEGL